MRIFRNLTTFHVTQCIKVLIFHLLGLRMRIAAPIVQAAVFPCLSVPCACSQETGGEFAYTSQGLLSEKFLTDCMSMLK